MDDYYFVIYCGIFGVAESALADEEREEFKVTPLPPRSRTMWDKR